MSNSFVRKKQSNQEPVPLKVFLLTEAHKSNVKTNAIVMRLARGKYPQYEIIRQKREPQRISGKLCACGNLAFKRDSASHSYVCERCNRIEHDYWLDYGL